MIPANAAESFDPEHLIDTHPYFVTPDCPLREVVQAMARENTSCTLVVQDRRLVGILTERDLVRLALTQTTLDTTPIAEVMTYPVVTLRRSECTDLFYAYNLMRRHHIRHLPIVDDHDRLVGLITLSTVRQALHLGYFLRFREVGELMTAHVVTTDRFTPLLEVARLMAQHRISCVVIAEVQDKWRKPIGIITERDMVKFQGQNLNLLELPAQAVMSSPLVTLHPRDSLSLAQQQMQQLGVRRLVVVGDRGELCGVLTETNLSQILDPLEIFGMLEILQHQVEQLKEDRDRLLQRENIELYKALKNNEFSLYFQPQLNLSTGKIVGAEALLRWYSPQQGFISPQKFIPLAEMTNLILELGEWVLRSACQQAMIWQHQGLPPLKISVNLSSHQMQHPKLNKIVHHTLQETGMQPEYLQLELTESSLVKNVDLTLDQFKLLKNLGVSIAIDDFGTGYASLGYLQHFPFDTLKIDRCFITKIHENKKNSAITTAIMRMAKQLQFDVIAEGVETEAERDFLALHQCEIIQGFLVSPPLPANQFPQWLRRHGYHS